MCKLWLCIVSVCGLIVAVKTACDHRPTGCQINNNGFANDTEVSTSAVLNCSFDGSLCCYRQGCFDDGMEQWKTNNSYANVRQHSAGCGANSYSILESPWVHVSTPSCVEFKYHIVLPYQLHVFLAFNNSAQPSLKHNSTEEEDNENHTSRFEVKCLTGKIQFRAKGGGGERSKEFPTLYYVRILEGPCTNLDQATSAPVNNPSVNDGDSTESLTNPLHTSTPLSEVPVTTTSSNTSYPSTIDTTGPTATVGNTTSPDGDSTSTPRPEVSVNTTSSGTSHPTTSEGTGPSSTVGDMTPTDADSTASHAQLQSTCPTPTKGTGPILSPVCYKTSPDGESDNSAAAIAGVMVTAVVLIVVIIVVVIVYKRKRRKGKPDDENKNTDDLPMTAGGTNTGNTASERRGNLFSRRDGDYTDIDVATTPSSDINPYDLADDGTNTNGSLGPNLQRLNGSKEDDYSPIDEAQPAAAHSEKNTTPVKPNPNDVYSVVSKPGKKTPTPGYGLAKIVGEKPVLPNPKDVYSVVNKKGKTFEPAAKPGEPDTEYNTISHNGNNTSSQKAPGDATFNPYNRIGAVSSIGLNENSRASTKPEDGLLTDDYNKLNLAGNGSMKEKSGAAGAAYDHVCNDPDDAYSKARIGKRYVVIDSDYHRLKP